MPFPRIFVTNKGKGIAINTPRQDTKDLECHCYGNNEHYAPICPTRNLNYLDNKNNDGDEDVLRDMVEPNQNESKYIPAKDELLMLVIRHILMAPKLED